MGAEFVTFDNAVNAMPRIIQRCGLYGCTQKLFMSFLLPADYPPCGLLGGNYGNAGRTLQMSFPSVCNFFHIDETPLVTCSCTKQNHVCQILYEVKEENGDIFGNLMRMLTGNMKANENDPVAWQVGAWTLDQMFLANTSHSSFLALYISSMS